MIAWCGSQADGLGWLCDRCFTVDKVEFAESIDNYAIDAVCALNPRRLILAVENRLDYPLAEIEHLRRYWPEVPLALAVGTWFDGSRRTGIGVTSHLSLPWYRWWDVWRPWLSGSNSELLNPWPKAIRSRANDHTFAIAGATGLILGNCRQTAESWRDALRYAQVTHAPNVVKQFSQANGIGFVRDRRSSTQLVHPVSHESCYRIGDSAPGTQLLTLAQFHSISSPGPQVSPDWILWDDSCLDTFAGADCLSEVSRLFAEIRERFPASLIIAATCMPRWSDWQQWELAGANELIAKPTQGTLLSEILQESLVCKCS